MKHGTTAGISYLYTARARYSTQRPGLPLDSGLWQCLQVSAYWCRQRRWKLDGAWSFEFDLFDKPAATYG